MIAVKLNTSDGELIAEIKLPSNPSELPLANYVSFMCEADKINLPGANVVNVMAKAVAELSGVPLDKILAANFGNDWDQDNGHIDGIRSMYGWAINAIGKWRGRLRDENDFSIVYKGQTYEIPVILLRSIGGNILPDVDTATAVEAYEVVRIFTQRIESGSGVRECVAMLQTLETDAEKEPYVKRLRSLVPKTNSIDLLAASYDELEQISAEHGDQNGDNLFSRYLHMMAILLRKKGEKMPTDESGKRTFLASRAQLFHEIDTATALDIDFFLHTIFNASKRTHPVIGSLIRQAFGRVVETRGMKEKRTKGLSNTIRRSLTGSVGKRLSSR